MEKTEQTLLKMTLSHHLFLWDPPESLEAILRQKLRFRNPKWEENNRLGRWNKDTPEYLRFYHKKGNGLLLPKGYVRQFILLCRREGISYEMKDQRRTLPECDFSFHGQLKDFQQKAAEAMLKKEFGTLSAPTGSGKTVIALYMIAQRKQPALIVVHTKELAFQWQERIQDFLGIPPEECGFIGAGKKTVGEKISVAMVQSLYKCAKETAARIGYIIVDECHRTPSRTFTEAVSAFDARYMLGLTATPWRRDKLSQLIFWHLGDVHYSIDKSGLVDEGHILEAEVVIRETGFKPWFDPVREYSKMLSELTADDERNELITADAAKEVREGRGICLLLSDRKKHCKNLQALMKFRHGIDTELLIGDMSAAARKEVLDRIGRGEVRVIVATGQLIGEGFDCRDLSTLFICTPIRFSGRLLQYLGRILRPAPGKTTARVYDYVDVHVGPLQAAALVRQRVYNARQK